MDNFGLIMILAGTNFGLVAILNELIRIRKNLENKKNEQDEQENIF